MEGKGPGKKIKKARASLQQPQCTGKGTSATEKAGTARERASETTSALFFAAAFSFGAGRLFYPPTRHLRGYYRARAHSPPATRRFQAATAARASDWTKRADGSSMQTTAPPAFTAVAEERRGPCAGASCGEGARACRRTDG